MELKDVKANQGNIEVVVTIVQKDSPRAFEKFGKTGKVCNATVKDQSGEVKMTLWNDDVDKVKVGDKVKIVNGWCSEYKGEKQLSTGKFGKIEVVEAGVAAVFTNDPTVLKAPGGDDDDGDDGDGEGTEPVDAEEFVD